MSRPTSRRAVVTPLTRRTLPVRVSRTARSPRRSPSAVSLGNGVYGYGSSLTLPNDTFNATNYWVDVVFTEP